MAKSKDEAAQKKLSQAASQYGTVWLNPLFTTSNPVRAVVGNIRISRGEKVWWALIAIFVMFFLLILKSIVGTWGPFYVITNWWAMPIWALLIGYKSRVLANASPLRRETGEGSGTWIKIQLFKVIRRIDKFFRPNKVQLTQVISYKTKGSRDRQPMIAEAEVYMGTAPLPESGLYDQWPVEYEGNLPVYRQSTHYYSYHRGNDYQIKPKGELTPR